VSSVAGDLGTPLSIAAVAELEAGLISERTKAALAQAKARGVRLGNPRLRPGTREQGLQAAVAKQRQAADRAARVRPYIEAARKAGCTTLAQLAEALNARGRESPTK
jgi:DNA invertase Pin-like site-specific DNA recombinase